MKRLFYKSNDFSPFVNLATEMMLFDLVDDDTEILYLWQNDNTVVIGKNQNAYTECNVVLLESEGGKLARRSSGGGAVYHDKGNLNFTFISSAKNYSKQRNFSIVLDAVRSLGFDAVLSGRNDLVIAEKKFSGNAFYKNERAALHHGTILINSDFTKLSRYLNVPKAKLEAKGVSSVVSRVVNLSEIKSVTVSEVEKAFVSAFEKQYGKCELADVSPEIEKKYIAKFSSDDWNKGDNIFYDARIEKRFEWGTADIRLKINGDVISEARIYSDSLEDIAQKERLLAGASLTAGRTEVNDIIEAFKEQKNGF